VRTQLYVAGPDVQLLLAETGSVLEPGPGPDLRRSRAVNRPERRQSNSPVRLDRRRTDEEIADHILGVGYRPAARFEALGYRDEHRGDPDRADEPPDDDRS
jgi:hypothetical protein